MWQALYVRPYGEEKAKKRAAHVHKSAKKALRKAAAVGGSFSTDGGGGGGKGLTLVHFSPQPEPFLTHEHTLITPEHPLKPHYHPLNTTQTHPLSNGKSA
jgi:hypothetical protein